MIIKQNNFEISTFELKTGDFYIDHTHGRSPSKAINNHLHLPAHVGGVGVAGGATERIVKRSCLVKRVLPES